MKYIITFLLIVFIGSCSRSNKINNIIGKWYNVDIEENFGYRNEEYVEAHFKDGEVFFLAFQRFDRVHIHYEIDSDSIYYLDYDYSIGYKVVNETNLVLVDTEKAHTFIKLDNSIVTYDEVNMGDSTLKEAFIREFKARALEAMEKHKTK